MDKLTYEISCSKDIFNDIKTDDRFLKLLTLARCVNSLKFCLKPMLALNDSLTPAADGSIYNSIFFSCSVLYEGFLLVENFARDFRDYESFKNGFGNLLRNRNVKLLRENYLNRIRNKFVFHFDSTVPKESLINFELPEYKFASGTGSTSGEMHFILADEVVFNYFIQPSKNETDDDLKKRYKKFLEETSDTIYRFNECAETLMADVLERMGFTVIFHRK